MNINIIKKREKDGSVRLIGFTNKSAVVAEVLRLGSLPKNSVAGRMMFQVEEVSEINGTSLLPFINNHHKHNDGVKFICPDCKGTRLECCEDGAYSSEVLNIDDEGDFDFGDINASGQVDRFQCIQCSYVLEQRYGTDFASHPLTQHEEVVEWCKEHCKQE